MGSHGKHWIDLLGLLAVVDLMAVALLLLTLFGLPGGSVVVLNSGIYCFLLFVLAGWVSVLVEHRIVTSAVSDGECRHPVQKLLSFFSLRIRSEELPSTVKSGTVDRK
jgi:hypothetical protein